MHFCQSSKQIFPTMCTNNNCDTIYHIPAFTSQINLGVTLNSLMAKVERTQYQAAVAITGT